MSEGCVDKTVRKKKPPQGPNNSHFYQMRKSVSNQKLLLQVKQKQTEEEQEDLVLIEEIMSNFSDQEEDIPNEHDGKRDQEAEDNYLSHPALV